MKLFFWSYYFFKELSLVSGKLQYYIDENPGQHNGDAGKQDMKPDIQTKLGASEE